MRPSEEEDGKQQEDGQRNRGESRSRGALDECVLHIRDLDALVRNNTLREEQVGAGATTASESLVSVTAVLAGSKVVAAAVIAPISNIVDVASANRSSTFVAEEDGGTSD